ncbi:MAG: hypothetical protein ACLFM0_04085 [Spirochaetales bacterium]
MQIRELRDLKRKDVPLAYRRTFTAEAVLDGENSGETRQPVEFDLEQTAAGTTQVKIRLIGSARYPVIPLMRALHAYITTMHARGKLN